MTTEVAADADSKATTAASDALQAAIDASNAQDTADGAALLAQGMYQVIPSDTEPTVGVGGVALKQGDQWWEIGTGGDAGKFVGVHVFNGTVWQELQLVADSVLVPSSVGNVLIADGAIDGKTITGATIRTAASGQRFEMDASSLRAYKEDGALSSTMLPTGQGFTIVDGAYEVISGSYVSYLNAGGWGSRKYNGEDMESSLVSNFYGGHWKLISTDAPMTIKAADGLTIDADTEFTGTVTFADDVPEGSLPGTKVGSRTIDYATLEVRSGWIYINMQQTGNMATGTVELWSGLPVQYRPVNTVISTANLANYPCIAVVRPAGTIAVVNQSGATRAWGMMSFAYPIPR